MNADQRPDPLEILRRISAETPRGALLRAYVGYARCVGATTAMLDEARRRAARGTDVVIAAYRVHGDPATALSGLDLVGLPRPAALLDVEAVLARNPEVACIDDLAASDVHGKPVIDSVPRLLRTGMTVLATFHLLSVRSAADAFADLLGGRAPGYVIDDATLEMLDEVELIDIPPSDLLQRLREQHVLAPGELAYALQGELRTHVLASLRETAFRLVAEQTDRQLVGYMRESAPASPWAVRGRIVMCLPPEPGLESRIRRAARYALAQDAKLAVATVRTRPMSEAEKEWMGGYATLVHQLGGEFVHLHGSPVARTLVEFIRESLATEVILGHRRRRWRPRDTTSDVIRRLSGVDVHVLRAEPPP